LRQIVKRSRDAKQVRRAQALLWLDQGEPVTNVARRQEVSRQTVYDWVRSFQERRHEPMAQRLRDRHRCGRPPEKGKAVEAFVERVMGTDPRQLGYHSPVWTIPLLCQHLKLEQGIEVSERTFRRCLKSMGYRYKRPRYVLSRRFPTWRQAKGGSSAA
ncbi:MAG TPA: helix-turn-helix domain-containing protein, partial [Candidatus Latescibacteria bacterium]|nr:helix-turn-helix domain-containing protein [Candidatus Latescibacterota bacterium]